MPGELRWWKVIEANIGQINDFRRGKVNESKVGKVNDCLDEIYHLPAALLINLYTTHLRQSLFV